MNKKIALICLAGMVLIGCAYYGGTLKFTGPGTFQEFAQARYQCAQETAAPQGGAVVNRYGGAASTSVVPNCSAFSACLAAKGYFRNPNGNLDASSIPIDCR